MAPGGGLLPAPRGKLLASNTCGILVRAAPFPEQRIKTAVGEQIAGPYHVVAAVAATTEIGAAAEAAVGVAVLPLLWIAAGTGKGQPGVAAGSLPGEGPLLPGTPLTTIQWRVHRVDTPTTKGNSFTQ